MGNIISSFLSGFAKVVGSLFGAPLDFLAGKSCSSACGSTWDLFCYIENFCIANILKMVVVLVLFYIVLLLFYLLYKMGICDCVGRSLCKMLWALLVSCFSICEHGCVFLWNKLRNLKHMNKKNPRDREDYYSSEELEEDDRSSHSENVPRAIVIRRSLSRRSREHRRIHMRSSLKPRSHKINVGISRDSVFMNDRAAAKHIKTVHNIKVTRTSKFVQKGNGNRLYHRKGRW